MSVRGLGSRCPGRGAGGAAGISKGTAHRLSRIRRGLHPKMADIMLEKSVRFVPADVADGAAVEKAAPPAAPERGAVRSRPPEPLAEPLPPERPSVPKRRRLTGKQPDALGVFCGSAVGSPAAGATNVACTTPFLHGELLTGETATGEAAFELPPEFNGEMFGNYLPELGSDGVGSHPQHEGQQFSQGNVEEDVFGHGEDIGEAAYYDG